MGRYLLRRLLQLIPVFIGTTFLIYWLVWSVPGDPFAGKCGERPCPDSFVNMMTEKFKLDEPLIAAVRQLHEEPLPGRLRADVRWPGDR